MIDGVRDSAFQIGIHNSEIGINAEPHVLYPLTFRWYTRGKAAIMTSYGHLS